MPLTTLDGCGRVWQAVVWYYNFCSLVRSLRQVNFLFDSNSGIMIWHRSHRQFISIWIVEQMAFSSKLLRLVDKCSVLGNFPTIFLKLRFTQNIVDVQGSEVHTFESIRYTCTTLNSQVEHYVYGRYRFWNEFNA